MFDAAELGGRVLVAAEAAKEEGTGVGSPRWAELAKGVEFEGLSGKVIFFCRDVFHVLFLFRLVRFGLLLMFGFVMFVMFRFRSFMFGSVRFGSSLFCFFQSFSVRIGSARLGSVRFDSVRFSSFLFCPIQSLSVGRCSVWSVRLISGSCHPVRYRAF